jgi:large subunit ribosomal protein L1
MPNPKSGTVTMDVAKAVSDVKAGKIDFKVDKTGIVHAPIGKASFSADKLVGNANELLIHLNKVKTYSGKRDLCKKYLLVKYYESKYSN